MHLELILLARVLDGGHRVDGDLVEAQVHAGEGGVTVQPLAQQPARLVKVRVG